MPNPNPSNVGITEFPTVFHMRLTVEMKQAIISRGGARWLRSLIEANTRIPENVATIGEAEKALHGGGATGGGSPVVKRVKRATSKAPGKPRRRVSLDKRKS